MTTILTALFETRHAMEDALRKLEDIGITESQIGVIMNDDVHGKSFEIENNDKSDAGLAIGATMGGIVGGIAAAIAGVGSLAIPGLNLVVVGSIVSGLAGLGVGAAAGGLIGGLVGMGVPEHEAKLYDGKLTAGHILLAVEARDKDQATQVRGVFKRSDANRLAA